MWQAHAIHGDENRDLDRVTFKSKLSISFSFAKQFSSILSSLSTRHPHLHTDLPTFVLDQHALQSGTSRDLAQPQFPVHLLPWSGQLPVPVSKETLWFSRSAVLTLNSCFKAWLCLCSLRRWRLKSTSVHSSGKKKKGLRSTIYFSKPSPSTWEYKCCTWSSRREMETPQTKYLPTLSLNQTS